MASIVLEKVVKELKLVKGVITSSYWQSQALLQLSILLTTRYFKCCYVMTEWMANKYFLS